MNSSSPFKENVVSLYNIVSKISLILLENNTALYEKHDKKKEKEIEDFVIFPWHCSLWNAEFNVSRGSHCYVGNQTNVIDRLYVCFEWKWCIMNPLFVDHTLWRETQLHWAMIVLVYGVPIIPIELHAAAACICTRNLHSSQYDKVK